MDTNTIDRELRDAILARDVTSVKRLLAAGAPLDRRVAGDTPLHFCLSNYCWMINRRDVPPESMKRAEELDIIQELVEKVKNDIDILDAFDDRGKSPLHEAILYGDLETVKMLVRAGASVENINSSKENALHVATLAKQHHVLKYFLENHDIPNSNNKRNFTPMHLSAMSGKVESMELLLKKFGHEQLVRRNYEGRTVWHEVFTEQAQFLLQAGDGRYRSDLNLVDNEGNTPLFLAARQGDAALTALLLRNGATLAARRATTSAIKEISKGFNDPLTFLKDILDDCVYETKTSIEVDYKVLTDSDSSDHKGMSQIKAVEELVRWGQSDLLKHPMIESLIYLKWKCLLPVFYIIVANYATFLGAFTFFVVTTFNTIDTFNRTQNGSLSTNDVPCVEGYGQSYWTLLVFIYMSITVLFIQECVWIRLRKLRYLAHREPWVKVFGLALAALVPALVGCSPEPAPAPWQRCVACAALLLAWLQAMLLLSRIPGWGYYVLMFERVAINLMKVLLTSTCLVVGFSVCFMILYESKPPFNGFFAAFVKTLVMMLSEFDYENLFGKDHAELEGKRPIVRLLFVTFVIFIAIVMMNFMIGVAVSDIKDLNNIGNVRRLEKQVELLSTLEGLGDTVLARWWKRLSYIRFHSDMGRALTEQGRRWVVYPNQYNRSYENFRQTFNQELHNAICNLASKKKQNVNKLDVLYDAVVEAPQNTKRHIGESSDQNPPQHVTTMKDRIKSIEDSNKEITQLINALKEVNDRRSTEMKQYIDQLTEDINKQLKQCLDNLKKVSDRNQKHMKMMLKIVDRLVRRRRSRGSTPK